MPKTEKSKKSEKKEKKEKKPKKVEEDVDEAPVETKTKKIIKKSYKKSPQKSPLLTTSNVTVVGKRKISALGEMEAQAKKKAKKEAEKMLEEEETAAVNGSDETAKKDEYHVDNFPLSATTKQALADKGISTLFEIQAATFHSIVNGEDIIGKARTGCGKTLAFSLPIIEKLLKNPRTRRGRPPSVLVLAPTRELAIQVGKEMTSVAPKLEVLCVYGGSSIDAQRRQMRAGIDILVGTPGRVIDHIERGNLDLAEIEHVVLDEADQMLDMGFQDDVDKILQEIKCEHQTCLFSATVPKWVKEIGDKYMKNHRLIDTVKESQGSASLNVRHISIMTHYTARTVTISDCIGMYAGATGRCIVFCNTKSECNDMCSDPSMKYEAKPLHGDIAQASRETTLEAFKNGKFRVLVATDVAARGLDMIVDLVINSCPPETRSGYAEVETYVHRSGRTGRAGRKGICVTLYQPKAKRILQQIERTVKNNFEWLSAPQPADVMRIAADTAVEDASSVPSAVAKNFTEPALALLKKYGGDAESALAAALALATGHTTLPPSRSILTNAIGYTTYMFSSRRSPIEANGYVWGALRRCLPDEVCDDKKAVASMQISKDKSCAVFDVRNDVEVHFEHEMKNGGSSFSIPEELPELQEQDFGKGKGKGKGKGGKGDRGGKGGKGSKGSKGGKKGSWW